LQKVKAPAIGLLVGGILLILGGLYNMADVLLRKDEVVAQFNFGFRGAQGRPQAGPDANAAYTMVLVVMIFFTLITLVIGGLIIFGALKMMNLKAYGLVMAACIVGMLPCSLGCIVSLAMGIWSLVAINNAEVKPFFR